MLECRVCNNACALHVEHQSTYERLERLELSCLHQLARLPGCHRGQGIHHVVNRWRWSHWKWHSHTMIVSARGHGNGLSNSGPYLIVDKESFLYHLDEFLEEEMLLQSESLVVSLSRTCSRGFSPCFYNGSFALCKSSPVDPTRKTR